MKNIDKLVDMVVHIERVLEKKIPTGYRQIVTEYVRQHMVPAIVAGICLIISLICTVCLIVQFLKLLKEYRVNGFNDRKFNIAGIYLLLLLLFIIADGVSLSILVDNVQHIVAPNWYIINGLIHK